MGLIINIIVIAIILGFAGYQIFRAVKRSKQGKCAACDYDCEAKKLLNQSKKRSL
ncbi:hypothetical protein IWT140_00612 [Secundilactobacillus pentosiphilus]|uniref:FeoB-associated Cys-rich membrane protein n=1 Tax=Secundilactobacillus pentosiphilus TaxID=1714682 RepID=A0A1Z5IMM8_9LACO|nr:FeoB-associated Cys-rich membrane protein [Secundilactobacillus pentosiphilus]GAX03014.1 hypothetical protein IWT140_00612 [Secundilactobacillus pentosiphilus]